MGNPAASRLPSSSASSTASTRLLARHAARSAKPARHAPALSTRPMKLDALARDSRTRLATMRDPLTRYGAPAITEDTLAAAWNQLDGWARAREMTLTGDITKARNGADDAAKEYQAAIDALSHALIRAELSLPDLHAPANELHTAVTREVAGAAASARSAAEHAADRFRERARLHKQKDEAAEQAQVAATLANLLRSDAFQAWRPGKCTHLPHSRRLRPPARHVLRPVRAADPQQGHRSRPPRRCSLDPPSQDPIRRRNVPSLPRAGARPQPARLLLAASGAAKLELHLPRRGIRHPRRNGASTSSRAHWRIWPRPESGWSASSPTFPL